MKVVVTGGSGQLGTLVLRRLAFDRKVKQLVSIDLRPPVVASAKLRAVTCDVRSPELAQHLEGADVVVHLAFVVTAYLARAEFDAINVGGSKNVLGAAIRAGVKQLIYSSSIAAYGVVPGHPVPIVEDTRRVRQPDFAYSCAKYDVEAFLDELERAHPEVAVCRLRPAILVGTHMDHALGDALRRGVLPDSGDPAPLPLVWDEDVADAILSALKRSARGAFNLCADEALTARGLARATGLGTLRLSPWMSWAAARALPLLGKLGVARTPDPAWLKARSARMIISSEKALAQLDWRPKAPSCADVIRRHRAEAPRKLDPGLSLFFRLLSLAVRFVKPPAEARPMSARILLALTGASGGDLGLVLEQGRLSVARGAPRPPTAVVTVSAETFRDLLSGRLDFGSAQLTGRIRFEGEPIASLIIQALVTGVRTAERAPGLRGAVARKFTRLIAGEKKLRAPAREGAPA